MAKRPQTHTPTTLQLSRLLHRHLDKPLAELAELALSWRITPLRLVLLVNNPFWGDTLIERLRQPLEGFAQQHQRSLHIISGSVTNTATEHDRITFTNFLSDPGNEFAIATCRSAAQAPGVNHNPIYLSGPTGSGKTHLLHATAASMQENLGEEAVVILTGSEWLTIAGQFSEGQAHPIRQHIEDAVAIFFDDLDVLRDRAVAQEEAFHLINNALERGQQLLFTGQLPPNRLRHFEERLATRLAWGIAITVETPAPETRLKALLQLLGPAAAEQDRQELMSAIEAFAPDMHQVAAVAERLLRGEKLSADPGKASFDRILAAVAERYHIRASDIAGKRRQRHISHARQTTLLLARRLTSYSLEALGGMVGGRDHSTILHAIRQAELRLEEEKEYHKQVEELTQSILS
jgi:chromosomal replication initiator protein